MIREFCEKIGFPEEAIIFFCDLYDQVGSAKEWDRAIEAYFNGDEETYKGIIENISKQKNIHKYSLDMLLLICCAKPLHEKYREKGYSDDMYWCAMSDLKCKLLECKKLYNLWGTSTESWFKRFFHCECFALGRLQFEQVNINYAYKDLIKAGDLVINCHIPSSGPLTKESVEDAFRQAYDFFGVEGPMYVHCNSWMLYPPHYKLFPENSNLRRFYDLFDVVHSQPDENLDLWRIFDKNTFEEIVPGDIKSTLQKNFYEYLKSGNTMGSGKGIHIYNK